MTLLDGAQPALGFLFACSVKATVLLVLTILTASLLRHRSAALRHQVWAVGILASLALPVLTFLLPAWHSASLGDAAGFLSQPHPVAAHPNSQSLPSMVVDAASASPLLSQLRGWLVLSWAVGVLLIVLRLLGGLARTAWISAHSVTVTADDWAGSLADISRSLEIACRVPVLQCSNPAAMPVTWGVFRPRIILPADAIEWSSDRRRIVLTHELAHIARQDWPVQICAKLVGAFYWFHPLAWIAAARLRQESERACDDTVLNSGLDASDYASQLLELARTLKSSERSWSVALAIARPSHLERRFLCKNRTGQFPFGKTAVKNSAGADPECRLSLSWASSQNKETGPSRVARRARFCISNTRPETRGSPGARQPPAMGSTSSWARGPASWLFPPFRLFRSFRSSRFLLRLC